MKQLFLCLFTLVSSVSCINANAWQSSELTFETPSQGQDNTNLTARQILDIINRRQVQQMQDTHPDAPPFDPSKSEIELRPSRLILQGTGPLKAEIQEGNSQAFSASSIAQTTHIPSGWFRKTAYAWSVGDNQLLAYQLGAGFAMILPWACIVFAILLSEYLERRKRELRMKRPLK